MSFQDEYKITSADRLDKGVYGLPDTPGMTTAAIQERFDSLGNLAIDKFNALVEAASDVIDGSDTKFPTNKAVEDYISGEGGAIIDDTTPSLHKAYSSQKVENMFDDVASRVIDDTEPLSNKTYSSAEIEEKLSNIPSPESIIDDDTASTDTTYSSSKLESDFISISDTEEQTATDEFTTINGGLLSECKVSLTPNQDLHGYDSPWVGGAGKNKLQVTTYSRTMSGVTFTVNEDGTVLANGTATGNINFRVNEVYDIPEGNYILSDGIQNNSNNINLTTYKNNTWVAATNVQDNVEFQVDSDGDIRQVIYIANGITVNNLLFKPMIRLASESDPTFEPYENICPISGHTQVEVENDGKNRFDGIWEEGYIGANGAVFSSDGSRYTTDYCKISFSNYYITLPQGYYAYRFAFYNENKNFISMYDQATATSGKAIATPQNAVYTRATIRNNDGTVFATTNVWCQIELGSTATPYVPYNGYQITVNLGGTYYSGTLDVVTGVFVVDRGFYTFDGTEPWTSVNVGWGTNIVDSAIKSNLANDNVANIVCSILKASTPNAVWTGAEDMIITVARQGDPNKIRFYNSQLVGSTASDVATFMSGVQICYELANPTTIQLSPTMVKALVGENHLSAPLEGQEITESVYSPLAKWNAVIDDTTASDDTTYSSNKINAIVPKINDSAASASSVYSSNKVEALIAGIPSGVQIDDDNESYTTTFSSAKIVELINGMSKPISGSITSRRNITIEVE